MEEIKIIQEKLTDVENQRVRKQVYVLGPATTTGKKSLNEICDITTQSIYILLFF